MKTSKEYAYAAPPTPVTRRRFVVGVVAAAIASKLLRRRSLAAEPGKTSTLAILGGEKSVKSPLPQRIRWGLPERERLNAMLEQRSLFYWKGPQTSALIDRFRAICPLKYVQTCSSGTAALHVAVAAAGIAPGDEVITTPITDVGTIVGVIFQQAVPVFADLVPNSYNLDPVDVERRITEKTKAIIAVHLCGNPCDMQALKAIAEKHKLVLIEDCAQAWGARYRGQPIGTVGHIACFSFQDAKHVTCGDGGIVACNEEHFGSRLQPLGDKGIDRVHGHGLFELFAANYRMSEPQAAVAAAQLERVETIVNRRAALGKSLGEKLSTIVGIIPHFVHPDDRCSFWFYYLRLKASAFRCTREEFVKALSAEGVSCSAGYIPVPLHRNPVFLNHAFFAGRWPVRDFGMTSMDYSKHTTPEAEAILQTGIRIVINEAMTDAYIESVGEAIKKVAEYYAIT